MNDHDRKNLEFLLTSDNKTLSKWYKTLEMDDIAYALELLDTYTTIKALTSDEEINDLSQAKTLLKKYTLGTK